MREINLIIVHCAATKGSMDVGAKEIRQWHISPPPKGNGWADIGYHIVIRRSGEIEQGRNFAQPGAHCTGKNANSIGVCLVGGLNDSGQPYKNFTNAQMATLKNVATDLLRRFPSAEVAGHNEFAAKACPCFDVKNWWQEVNE